MGGLVRPAAADARTRIFEELQQLRPRELLFASSLPLFDSAQKSDGNKGWAETPLEDWAFAADYAIPGPWPAALEMTEVGSGGRGSSLVVSNHRL